LDIHRVRAHVIPIPHISKVIIAIPIHVRSDSLIIFIKNFLCSCTRLPQVNANPSVGVIFIDAFIACDAWETFFDRGGKQVR
jgi:hypothetical protein